MSKPSQVLQIDPPFEIRFKGPFTDVAKSYIKLTNTGDKHICFKVKTTAPKQYCVTPNTGLIQAHETIRVAIMLRPFDHNSEDYYNHQFKVQTAYIPDGEQSLDNIWKNTPASEMMDSKLLVKFEAPEINSLDKQNVQKISMASSQKRTLSTEAEFRCMIDDVKRLDNYFQQIEQEISQLRERVKQLESHQFSVGSSSTGGAHQFSVGSSLMDGADLFY